MTSTRQIEDRIKKFGTELYSLIGGAVPSFFDTGKWKGKLMRWAMKDENSKVQLFRFIDVFPALQNDELVMRMVDEYFAGMEDAPTMILRGITRVSKKITLPRIAAAMIRSSVESFGRQFIAGRDAQNVLEALRRLRDEGAAFTLDVLGEAVLGDAEVLQYRDRYVQLLNFLAPQVKAWPEVAILDRDHRGVIPRLEISLKISSFNAHLEPMDWDASITDTVAGLAPVLETARSLGAGVTLDMEQYYVKDVTRAIFQRIVEQYPDLPRPGIVLQAYLKDAREDLINLIQWVKRKGFRICLRLVKGAYWDYETILSRQRGWPCPVFLTKEETDHNYEELSRIILENSDYLHPAFGTHSMRSISHAAAAAEFLGLPRSAVEFQTIYGMAEPIRRALERMGFRVRVYAPVGELIPGMAYLIRRLLENTSNESFLRKSFSEDIPFEELIRAPQPGKGIVEAKSSGDGFRNEPAIDFSRAQNRAEMTKALQRTRRQFDKRYPLVIGGDEVWRDEEITSVNPAKPGEVVGRVSRATVKEAEKAVEAAKKAWKTWRNTSADERARYVFSAAEYMRTNRFELAALQVYEVGKAWQEADADVAEAIDFLEYYGREMLRLGTPTVLGDLPGEENLYVCEPKGVGLVISPWNFPLAIPTGMVAAGLVTGNCIIFKPSSLSPACAWKLVECFREVGLPPGVLQFVPGSGEEIGEYLTAHPDIQFIAFTGSKDAGLRIVRRAGETEPMQRHIKSVIAEMGGKNAIIVDETADLDEAVKGVVQSALGFQGQKCSACSRVIVVGHVADDFCRRLKNAMESVKTGPTEDPGNFMGPLVDQGALEKIRKYIDVGMKTSTPLLVSKIDRDGYFVGPAIFVDVQPDSPLAQEEIFGPVLAVMKARDIDEAIALANNTPYALTGGIFSRSPANIRKAQTEFRVGNLYVNRKITGAMVGRQPFGGFGMSGAGTKAGGPDYLRHFVYMRSLSENTMRRGFAPTGPKPR